jgi:hypothetical protein
MSSPAASFLDMLALLADPAATKARYDELQAAVDKANRSLAAAAVEQSKFDEEARTHRDRLTAMKAKHDDDLARETDERRKELDDRESVLNSRERKLLQGEEALVRERAKHEAQARDRMTQLNMARRA